MSYHKVRTSKGKYKFVKKGKLLPSIYREVKDFAISVLVGYAILDITLHLLRGI